LSIGHFQERWGKLKPENDSRDFEILANSIATQFIDKYFENDEYDSDCIQLLCEMATGSQNEELNQIASSSIFGIVIERLCDDFAPKQAQTYNTVMCDITTFVRNLSSGNSLDKALDNFRLLSRDALNERVESMRLLPETPVSAPNLKKVIILSRVTIGADVAITSVISQRVAEKFPAASISIMGNPKLEQVFSEKSGVAIHNIAYARRGTLLQRFLAWLDLIREINLELEGLEPAQYLVLDPDSRLTQLGVLPVVLDASYRFFNSRGRDDYPSDGSMSHLTNIWLDRLFGKTEFTYPTIWPLDSWFTTAAILRSRIISPTSPKLISINFGVGGNDSKRVPGDFETELILALLLDPEISIVLDLGFGDEENLRTRDILRAVADQGYLTQSIQFDEAEKVANKCRVIGIESSISQVAAIIANCDEFIGYDSACQHIAAASGIRTFTVFAGSNNKKFIQRWRACGKNISETVIVDTSEASREIDSTEVIENLMTLRQ
jgi:ADP-heptose:LPS heptosyltransferase